MLAAIESQHPFALNPAVSRMDEVTEQNKGDIVEELYAWIDEIPFSRPKKNIPRDFSDAVLMAEVLKIYYPRYVDVHNYIPASGVSTKRDNWATLNRKVLSKIDMKLSKEMINQLANSQQGIIEKVLLELRGKILKGLSPERESLNDEAEEIDKIGYEEEEVEVELVVHERKSSKAIEVAVVSSLAFIRATRFLKSVVKNACGSLVGWIWPFSWYIKDQMEEVSASNSAVSGTKQLHPQEGDPVQLDHKEEEDKDGNKTVPRYIYVRLKQELHEKNDTISILNHKVAHLESLMKIKDHRIADLIAQVPSGLLEPGQSPRPHVIGSSLSKLRTRPSKIQDPRTI